MNTINLSIAAIQVNTYDTRRYGNTFYSYATATYQGATYDMKDPFPASKFPKYEAVNTIISRLAENSQVTIPEREYRQLFKGMRNGAQAYANNAAYLEARGVTFE